MKKNIIILVCLALFLQTNLFAQISNTAVAEVKYFPNSAYPKVTDVAMLNDTTSIIFSEITDNGIYNETFYLVAEGSYTVPQVIHNDMLVYDIDILNDTLFFCGSKNSKAFVAWADVSSFFGTGVFNYQEIPEISYLSKIKPYHTSLGYLNLACLCSTNSTGGYSSYIAQIDVASNNYTIVEIPAVTNYNELCNDILVYQDYILVAGYMEHSAGLTPYGWSVRIYDKDNISNYFNNNLGLISNWERYYVDIISPAFLTKSQDEKKVALVSTAILSNNKLGTITTLSIFDLFVNANMVDYTYRYDIDSPIPITILCDVDMCYGDNGYYDLVMQTYDGGIYSSVFHTNLTFPTTMGCNIYTNQFMGMYSSIKTYSDYYFISIGDIQWNLSLWDRKLGAGNNDCDIYSYEDILDFLSRDVTYYSQQPPYINNITPLQQSYGELQSLEYEVKCINY